MKKIIFSTLVIIAACVIVLAFFQPWARVQASVTGVSKDLMDQASGELKDTPAAAKFINKLKGVTDAISGLGDIEIKTQVSGYNVPRMVNNKTSKVALSLAQIMFKSTEGLDWKSYLVYALPLCAILCAVLSVIGTRQKMAVLVMLILSGAISLAGLYNLHTMDIGTASIKITIAEGLWDSMHAFLFIAGTSLAWFIVDRK